VEKVNIQPTRNAVVEIFSDSVDEFGEIPPIDPPPEAVLAKDKPTAFCQIRYNAVSTVTSFCTTIHGPPLDVLRRPADTYQIASRNNNGNGKGGGIPERKTKWWLCLIELNLLFYQYFGDTKPRFGVHIVDATVTIVKEIASATTVTVLFSDKRKWTLDFEGPNDAKRFVFAVNESKKAIDGNSIFFKRTKHFRNKFANS
jgi:hypothetical protein